MPRICQPINVLKLTNVSIVRYKVGANTFELACYPNKVRDWREGKEPDISEVLQSDRIFTCVNKGQFARDAELMGAFGTTNFDECVKKILHDGDVPLAAQERKVMQRNFLTEVYTIALTKLKPVEKGLFLHIDTLKRMTHEAKIVPKMKRNLPPKACAALLVQKLVLAYPLEFGMSALDVRMDFPDSAVAKKCYTEILKPSAAFGVRQVNTEPATPGIGLEVYIGEDVEADLKAYCETNSIKFQVLRNVQMLTPAELAQRFALPDFLRSSTNAPGSKKQKGAAGSKEEAASDSGSESSSIISSEETPTADVFLSNSAKPKESLYDVLGEDKSNDSEPEGKGANDPSKDTQSPAKPPTRKDTDSSNDRGLEAATKYLLKGRRELHEETRLREKKIRSRERKEREVEKLKEVTAAAARKEEAQQPLPPAPAPTEEATKSPTWCPACQVDFADYLKQNIRQHTKMEWHVFNQKRHLRGQAPVTQQIFEDLSRDIREGYLAVEN